MFCIICLVGLVGASAAGKAQEAGGSAATQVRNFALTTERVRSFRKYTPLERAVLRPGDALHVYGEPGNFGWHSQKDGARFRITVSARLRRSDGRAVVSNISPLSLKHEAASQPSDFFFSLRLNINAPVGFYTIGVRLRDAISGQTTEKSFPRQLPTAASPAPDGCRYHRGAAGTKVGRV